MTCLSFESVSGIEDIYFFFLDSLSGGLIESSDLFHVPRVVDTLAVHAAYLSQIRTCTNKEEIRQNRTHYREKMSL